jgi:hypothetical protein
MDPFEGNLNIPVVLRYVMVTEGDPARTVMGFEFADMDLDLRMQLYNTVTGILEEGRHDSEV